MTKPLLTPDFCVIGAGSGGLSFAAGAAQMGARVVLLEEKHMGGDCLNTGCIPSKALIAAAKAGYSRTHATDFGWASSTTPVDFNKVRTHIKEVIAAIAPHDSVERFLKLGVTVIGERGTFQDGRTVETDSYIIQGKRFVIATGSKPLVPKIPGLEHVPFLTNETLFDLPHLPSHLAIIGGGPIGMEMAQAFRRLGSRVTVFEVSRVLPKDEPSLTAHLKGVLQDEGVDIHEHTHVTGVSSSNDGAVRISFEKTAGTAQACQASHLFVATGRDKNLERLGLEKAGVSYTPRGIVVRPTLQTTNPKIYALGDCIEGPLFTHAAGYQAGIALRNTIFGLRTKATTRIGPWVTYTDPELAHIGHTQEELQRREIPYRTLEIP
ncbi:MAG: FAD-dependent oxidoreductase, partial [Proteobacteria bacterium]|nr:FAD-dependent oxidoreductase [Pseudomonadota bacterium]